MSREQARIFELESALEEAQAGNRELVQAREEGARQERERIRVAVDGEVRYMISQDVYSQTEVDALKRALPLIDPKEADNAGRY